MDINDNLKSKLLSHSGSTKYLDFLQKSSSNRKSIRFQLNYGFIPLYCFTQIFVFFSISVALRSTVLCVPFAISMIYLYYICFFPKREIQDKVDDFLTLAIGLKDCESRKIMKNAEKALKSLSELGFDSGDRYLEDLDKGYNCGDKSSSDETSCSNRNNRKKYFIVQIITIASLYVAGHLLSAIVEYSKIAYVDNGYYNIQLLITLGIHSSSCIFILIDAIRLVKLMDLVENLAKDIFSYAKQSESLVEAELY